MGLGNFIFNTAVSVGVGAAVTAAAACTGPLGLAAAVAVKGAEAGVGIYAISSGVAAAGYTNIFLSNNSRRSNFGGSSSIFRAIRGIGFIRRSGGSSSGTNNQRSKSSHESSGNSNNTENKSGKSNTSGSGSKTSSSGGNTGGSNDPYRDPNKKDSNNSEDSDDSNSTDQDDDDDWDSSDEGDERNHRYKYIAKRYPGRSTYAKPLEIDHTIPMAVWKELLKKIKNCPENELSIHLKRALKIFRIILKNKDIYSLSARDLDRLMKEFPAIEILKLIHRHQFSTGNKELQKKFNELIVDFILAGNWDRAIEYIFKDQFQIARHLNVDPQEIENILNRQRSFVKYLLRKGILTNAEARRLLDAIDSLS